MQPMEKNVEKQLVVRTYEPDMNALKQTAKQLAHMQDTSLNLYGQGGEVLIVVTARAYAQAAATELTENVAEQFELALGPAAYGRGKGSLAYFTAGELIQSESTIAAADPATGALLAEEFSHTKGGAAVFLLHRSRQRGHVQNGTDLVVHVHGRDKGGFGADGLRQRPGIHMALGVRHHDGDAPALFF